MQDIERWLEWPEWARDAVVTDLSIQLGWRDRLLVLIGRPLLVTTKAMTANVVGRSEGRSRVSVVPIRWPWSRPRIAGAEARNRATMLKCCPHGHVDCCGHHDLEDMPVHTGGCP